MKNKYYIVYFYYGEERHDILTTFGLLMFIIMSTINKKIELNNIALHSYNDENFDIRNIKGE